MDEEIMQIKLFQIIYTVLVNQGKSNDEAFATACVLSGNDRYEWVLQNRREELEELIEICERDVKNI